MDKIRLSARDRDILALFQLQADTPMTLVAEKLKVGTHVVQHSLTRMVEAGVISRLPFINVYPLGYEQYGIFFSLAGTTALRQKVVNALVRSPLVAWVLSLGGDYQYGIGLCVRRAHEVTTFLRKLAESYGDIFFEKSIAVRVSCTLFQRGYLSNKRSLDEPLYYGETGQSAEIDALDHYILRALTALHYSSIRDMGQKLGISHTTIQGRLGILKKKKIFVGVALGINCSALGMHPFRLLLYVTKVSAGLRDEVFNFASRHPNVFAFIECVGSWDYELKVEVESPAALSKVTDALYDRFGNALHTVKILSVLGTSKLAFYPHHDPPAGMDKKKISVITSRIPLTAAPAWD